ncbi:hypothetical protein ALI22I_27330 [Saccharothrix sp. ALI-22-I]|nr:hypothetical protein ALI22I_27330 [Saccharothrix sp. ALI-22-I]
MLALAATGLLSGIASATPGETPPPPSGDDRAVSHSGNLEWNWDDACVKAGLTGEAFDGDVDGDTPTLVNTATSTHLTITGGLEGYTVTGVVVKGANAYNVYSSANFDEFPWEDLHSPEHDNKGAAEIPAISHWFFCAEEVPGESTTPTTPETPVEETASSTPVSTTTEAAAATTTTTAAAAAGAENALANTGFDGTWMLVLGLALVAAGAAFVASPKLRGLLRR